MSQSLRELVSLLTTGATSGDRDAAWKEILEIDSRLAQAEARVKELENMGIGFKAQKLAVDRAEQAEAERDRLREALQRIAVLDDSIDAAVAIAEDVLAAGAVQE